MPSPPAFVSTATRRPFGSGCEESSVATSISSSSDAGPRDAGLVEERLDARLRAGERSRVGAGGALAGRGRPALQREDRLAAGDAAGEPAEAARVAERLDVEQHDAGRLVVLPPLEQVVRGDVGLVPDRDERREPEPARVGRLEQREAERAGLGGEADVAARRRAGGEGRVQPRAGDRDPEAVRPDQPRAVRADEREQLLLPLGALAADLREAGRDDDERAHAAAQRVLGGGEHVLARDGDHGQVDGIRDLRHGRVAADAGDGRALRVHRVRGPGEVRLEHVAEELAADRAPPRRGADDGDRLRLEERAQRRDDGGVVALLDALLEALGRRDRELDLDDAAGELPLELEACALEDAEHRRVLGEHLGHEALDPDGRRPCRQALQQPSTDPPPLLRVGDGECRLGQRGIAQAHVVADCDDSLAVLVGEGADQRAALDPVRLEQRLDQLQPHVRQPVEAPVQALPRERAVEVEQRRRVGLPRWP